MSLKVQSTIFPFRVSLKDKHEWELRLDFSNPDSKPSRVLLEIDLPQEATFTLAGYSTHFETKYDPLKPGQAVSLKLPIFSSKHVRVGDFAGKVRLSEHMGEYGYVGKAYNREILLRVVP